MVKNDKEQETNQAKTSKLFISFAVQNNVTDLLKMRMCCLD